MDKKICHLLISYGNKNQVYTSDLLDSLNKASNDEHFIYCHLQYQKAKGIKVIVPRDRSKISALCCILLLFIKNSDFRKLYRQIGRNEIFKWIWLIDCGIDVLHVHHEHAISLSMLEYFKSKGVKIIITLRGRDLLVNTNDKHRFKELNRKLNCATQLHSISSFMNKRLYELFGLDGVIVYRGQSLPREEHQIINLNTLEPIKIIAVGRLVWEKGHIFLIESIARLKKRGLHVSVDIYGDGNLKEFLSFRIKQLDLEKEVILKGYVDNKILKSIYQNYNLAVQPSLSEALSNGLIDFSFHNLPCVITNYGGMSEVIRHEVNGIVFKGNNMLMMDDAILETKYLDFNNLVTFNKLNRVKYSKKREIKEMLKFYQ